MNNFDPVPPPPLYPPAKKLFPLGVVILGTVTVLIVLAVVGGIKVFQGAKISTAAAITTGNSFLDDVGQHNYVAARTLMTAPIQAKTPTGTLQAVETLVEKLHVTYISHGQPQWFIQSNNGSTSVRLTYPARYSKSVTTASLIVVQTNKGWQVYGAHYEF